MTTEKNWRTITDAEDYFNQQNKQLRLADRRPVVNRAADLVGPGIGVSCVRLTTFDDLLTTYNGYYSYEFVSPEASAAANAPNDSDSFVGFVTQDSLLGGVQTFHSLSTSQTYRRTFLRNPMDSSSIIFGIWLAEPRFQQGGTHVFPAVDPATTQYVILTFDETLPEPPAVIAQVNSDSEDIDLLAASAHTITESGFFLMVKNNTLDTVTDLQVSWTAVIS